jgi:peptidoglycan lytic transglycosylase G
VRVAAALLLASLGAAAAAPAADVELKIIFPEGLTVRQMADQVAHVRVRAIHLRHVTPVLTGTAYAKAAATTARPGGFPRGRSIEGFLFPDGYIFGPSTTPAQLIALQTSEFRSKWATVGLGGRKPYDVLIVASIVERETAVPSERALVSAVVWNRLARNMPLAIDATLRYGLGIPGTRPITAAEQRDQTPYNTNIRPGLPPTPIGNPGLPSMQAAAHPAAVDYLYYVRKPDKLHHFFTASEAEFCQKAKEYGYPGC